MSDSVANLSINRRSLLASAATVGALAAVELPHVHGAASADAPQLRIGVIGCGGRGSGATLDALGAAVKSVYPSLGYHTEEVAEGATVARQNVTVVALADLFDNRLTQCRTALGKLGISIPDDRCYLGVESYRDLLALDDVNYVILATPPHFRPYHLMAAIEAGKNVFMEKPAAVDGPGVRMVLKAGELAKQKKLGIAAGTQRRHDLAYRATVERLHNGEIGDIQYGKCYWDGGEIWVVPRESGWSDMEWQLRNWNYFNWLSGDHIVEQHVHNLDVLNWVIGKHPTKATVALGGRQVRTAEMYGNVFDHFAVEYEYPDGVTMFSQCRQINGCKNIVGEFVRGTKGTSNCADLIEPATGERWRYRGPKRSAYQLEHEHLIESILRGEPINEAQSIAESTLTAIMGRDAAYTGREITWDDALASEVRLGPDNYEFGPYEPLPVAKPGKHKAIT